MSTCGALFFVHNWSASAGMNVSWERWLSSVLILHVCKLQALVVYRNKMLSWCGMVTLSDVHVGTLMQCVLVTHLLILLIQMLYQFQSLGVRGSGQVPRGSMTKLRKRNFLDARCRHLSAISIRYLLFYSVCLTVVRVVCICGPWPMLQMSGISILLSSPFTEIVINIPVG